MWGRRVDHDSEDRNRRHQVERSEPHQSPFQRVVAVARGAPSATLHSELAAFDAAATSGDGLWDPQGVRSAASAVSALRFWLFDRVLSPSWPPAVTLSRTSRNSRGRSASSP